MKGVSGFYLREAIMFDQFLQTAGSYLASSGIKLLMSLILLLVGWKLIKVLVRILEKGRLSSKVDPTVLSFMKSFTAIALKVLLVITIMAILGVPMTSMIAVLGSAGLAIGLALQGSLTNLAGGVIILITKPFQVGDYVTIGTVEGTVKGINIFYTHLTTPDNKAIIIPNGTVTNATIVIGTALEKRRVDLSFTTSYDADVDQVKAVILKTAYAHEKVLSDPKPLARLQQHGDSALTFICRVWVKTEDYWDVYFDLMEGIKKVFDAEGIEIPYPQLDVHMKA